MKRVFLSHSPEDRSWADQLRMHLEPIRDQGLIDLWDDPRITAGSHWRKELRRVVNETDIAVLLMSPEYASSKTLRSNELAPLLKQAKDGKTLVLPVIVSHVRDDALRSLSELVPVNSPDQPLAGLSDVEQRRALDTISFLIAQAAGGDTIPEVRPPGAVQVGDPPHPGSIAGLWETRNPEAPDSRERVEGHERTDPLVRARERGFTAKQEILRRGGGAWTGDHVATHLALSPEAVDERRRSGALVGLSIDSDTYVFPAWQFGSEGLLPGLEDTLSMLGVNDPWMRAAYFLTRDLRLGGATPLEELRRGHLDAVRRAASGYGEHGAA